MDDNGYDLESVLSCAAETIQTAYKNYTLCRMQKSIKFELQFNNWVRKLAAETVNEFILRYIFLKRRSKPNPSNANREENFSVVTSLASVCTRTTTSAPIVKTPPRKSPRSIVEKLRQTTTCQHIKRVSATSTSSKAEALVSNFSLLRVIDKRAKDALTCRCAVVSMKPSEVQKLLDAIDMLSTSDTYDYNFKNTSHRVLLPLLHAPSLAASLTKFVRENYENRSILNTYPGTDSVISPTSNIVISESNAATIVKHMTKLLQGKWDSIRTFVLTACLERRPSQWLRTQVQSFVSLLGLPNSTSTILGNMDGATFLSIDDDDDILECKYNLGSSLLKARFMWYHHLLMSTETDWVSNIRPWDSPAIPQHSSTFASDKSQHGRSVTTSKWGKLYLEGDNSLNVEIAPFDELMDAFSASNRAYGWGYRSEDLVDICAKISNSYGILSTEGIDQHRWVSMKTSANIMKYANQLDCILQFENRNNDIFTVKVLIPNQCLRIIPTYLDVNCDRQLSTWSPENIEVGLCVRVGTYDLLKRSCDQYEWWDAPSENVLAQLAGQKAEIVSTSEIFSRKRVGIRIIIGNRTVIDALPLDALFEINTAGITKKNRTKSINRKNLDPASSQQLSSCVPKVILTTNCGIMPQINRYDDYYDKNAIEDPIKLSCSKSSDQSINQSAASTPVSDPTESQGLTTRGSDECSTLSEIQYLITPWADKRISSPHNATVKFTRNASLKHGDGTSKTGLTRHSSLSAIPIRTIDLSLPNELDKSISTNNGTNAGNANTLSRPLSRPSSSGPNRNSSGSALETKIKAVEKGHRKEKQFNRSSTVPKKTDNIFLHKVWQFEKNNSDRFLDSDPSKTDTDYRGHSDDRWGEVIDVRSFESTYIYGQQENTQIASPECDEVSDDSQPPSYNDTYPAIDSKETILTQAQFFLPQVVSAANLSRNTKM